MIVLLPLLRGARSIIINIFRMYLVVPVAVDGVVNGLASRTRPLTSELRSFISSRSLSTGSPPHAHVSLRVSLDNIFSFLFFFFARRERKKTKLRPPPRFVPTTVRFAATHALHPLTTSHQSTALLTFSNNTRHNSFENNSEWKIKIKIVPPSAAFLHVVVYNNLLYVYICSSIGGTHTQLTRWNPITIRQLRGKFVINW